MTDETSDDPSIEIRLRDGEWTVTEASGVEAEVSKVAVDGMGNGRLSVNYRPSDE